MKKFRCQTPEYITWSSMIYRCTNTKWHRYDRYGGRGITICQRWLDSFENFLADVGPKPEPHYTLERVDNDGNYEPGNVCWATRKQQARNRRSSRLLEFRGENRTMAEWGEITGIPAVTIEARLRVCGYTIEQALTQPLRGWGPGKFKRRKVDDGV